MKTQLDILLTENRRHAADQAAVELEAAGHRVHRCYEPDSPGFPCAAITESGTCPLDDGIDVALGVRDRVEPRPTRYEVGLSCAIRAGLPIAELGPEALDPFEPWVTVRATGGVADAVETAADQGMDGLRQAIAERIHRIVPAETAELITCDFERAGHRLVVHLQGPAIDERAKNAIAVRVLDAVWGSGRTYGEVDVTYHPAAAEAAGQR